MFMKRPRRRNPVAVALYVNAALLLAILAVILGRSDSASRLSLTPAAFAQAQQPIAGGAGLFIVPGQFSQNIWGLYLLDVDQQTICAYSVTGSPPALRLMAARNFRYDRRLNRYNVAGLTPEEVKDMVEKEQNSGRVTGANPQSPAPPAAQ
jgi:hypothetical protein